MTEPTTAPFILYRENHDYLTGQSRKILTHDGYPTTGLLIAITLIGSAFVVAICTALGTVEGSPAPALLVGVAFGVVGFWVLRRVRRLWRLAEEGTLLPGRVLSSTGANGEDGYLIRVEYHFASPRGRAVRGQSHTFRDDLKGTLPPPGTPIHVLFLDEEMHRPL